MKLEYDKLEAAIALAKRQRAGGTDYAFNDVTIGDMEELIKRAKIVDDLAARDAPYVGGDHGDTYCELCDAEIEYTERNARSSHNESCPWRRAKELQP